METFPGGRAVAPSYDFANRPTTLSGTLSGATTNYANVTKYWPHGAVFEMGYGNNVWRDLGYITSTFQPAGYWDTIGEDPNRFLWLQYPRWVNGSGRNNGTLQSAQVYAGAPAPWTSLPNVTAYFSYDGLNRLVSASEDSNWAQSYNYDQYGNMWMPSSTLAAPALGPAAPTSNVYSPYNNRNVYSSYDAVGNMTMFGSVALSYDAENRQTAAGSNSYAYDGVGHRVAKTTASGQTTFVYDAFGQLAAEYAGGTAWSKDYIRHVGQVVAIENASGSPCSTCYLSRDFLGTVRMVTDQYANIIARHDYAPFGQEIQSGVGPRTSLWGASDNVNQKFTGQERDGETNLDFFQARYLSSGIGRFNSPDPGNAGADLTNPQSWNGYVYVRNNPLTETDPSGASPCNIFGGTYEGSGTDPCHDASQHDPGPAESLTSIAGPGGVATGSMIGYQSPEIAQGLSAYLNNVRYGGYCDGPSATCGWGWVAGDDPLSILGFTNVHGLIGREGAVTFGKAVASSSCSGMLNLSAQSVYGLIKGTDVSIGPTAVLPNGDVASGRTWLPTTSGNPNPGSYTVHIAPNLDGWSAAATLLHELVHVIYGQYGAHFLNQSPGTTKSWIQFDGANVDNQDNNLRVLQNACGIG